MLSRRDHAGRSNSETSVEVSHDQPEHQSRRIRRAQPRPRGAALRRPAIHLRRVRRGGRPGGDAARASRNRTGGPGRRDAAQYARIRHRVLRDHVSRRRRGPDESAAQGAGGGLLPVQQRRQGVVRHARLRRRGQRRRRRNGLAVLDCRRRRPDGPDRRPARARVTGRTRRRRRRGHPAHLRNHRKTQGRHAHPRQPGPQRRRQLSAPWSRPGRTTW